MKYGFIYETTNLVNGKKYIGKHKRSQNNADPDDSWYLGSGKLLIYAIEKYGVENFSRRIICECDSEEELTSKELHYINVYNAAESEEYYNILDVPSPTFLGCHHTEDFKEHMSSIMKGRYVSDETKKKISISRSGKSMSKDSRVLISRSLLGNKRRLGRLASDETRKKLSAVRSGEKNPMYGRLGKDNPNYGRKNTKESIENMSAIRSEANTGKIWINNSTANRFVTVEEYESLQSQGYVKGRLPKDCHLICKRCGNTFISKSPRKRYCEVCDAY